MELHFHDHMLQNCWMEEKKNPASHLLSMAPNWCDEKESRSNRLEWIPHACVMYICEIVYNQVWLVLLPVIIICSRDVVCKFWKLPKSTAAEGENQSTILSGGELMPPPPGQTA